MTQASVRTMLLGAALAGAAALAPNPATAHQASERYIPLGQSPGVSGKLSVLGSVAGFADGELAVTTPASATPIKLRVLPTTRIWVDRSRTQQASLTGSAADLQPGRRVEVLADPATRQTATWIKIEAP